MVMHSRNKITIDILVLMDQENTELFHKLEQRWIKYFNINVIYDVPSSIEKYVSKKIHILFLEAEYYKLFKLDYYANWQTLEPKFVYVVASGARMITDIDIYKALADQIIYTTEPDYLLEWNSLAILRRYWNVSSKESTIIYKNIIADFVEQKIYLDQELLSLSRKEYEVLKILLLHRGSYVHKGVILKKVWETEIDGSRTLDQYIQKLKEKIGSNRFTTKRSFGVRFE